MIFEVWKYTEAYRSKASESQGEKDGRPYHTRELFRDTVLRSIRIDKLDSEM
jgi:hypothetical protein